MYTWSLKAFRSHDLQGKIMTTIMFGRIRLICDSKPRLSVTANTESSGSGPQKTRHGCPPVRSVSGNGPYTYTHAFKHAYGHTYIHAHTCKCIQTHTYTYIQTYRHTYIHAYIHAYIHT